MSLPQKPLNVVLSVTPLDAVQLEQEHALPVASLHALTELLASSVPVDRVYVQLICLHYDAYTVAAALSAVQYHGTLIALHPALPRPEMVRRELQSAFPDLTLRLQSLTEKAAHLATA